LDEGVNISSKFVGEYFDVSVCSVETSGLGGVGFLHFFR
jgi:hypothetical protein